MRKRYVRLIGSVLASVLLCTPLIASATTVAQNAVPFGIGVGAGLLLSQALNNSANNTCKGCQNIDATKPNYCATITCTTTSNGYTVSGKCGAPSECRVTTGQGIGGGTIQLGTIIQVIGLVATLSQLGKNAAAQPAPYYPPQYYTGCTNYYAVTTYSSDPCAIYNPNPVSDTIAQTPIADFSNDGATPVSQQLADLLQASGGGSSDASSNTIGGLALALNPALASSSNANGLANVPQGGASNAGGSSATFAETFVANIKDGLSEFAGFFSTDTLGSQQTFFGRLCTARPWASGFLAKVLTPFFDALCSRLSLQVGAVEMQGGAPQKGFVSTQIPVAKPVQKGPPAPAAEVDIWADPDSVRLSTRTKIFWTTKNVDSCVITGPSFEQHSLSGGGATVPITGPTTFTIDCDASGKVVSDSVTVNLSI